LQKSDDDTVERLAKAIELAPATIRRHLDILQRDRLVAFREVRKKTGRPEYSFHLTEEGHEALPKAYDQLLGHVIRELAGLTIEDTKGRDGDQILEMLFRRLSSQVWSRHEAQMAGKDASQRLVGLLEVLRAEDFSPEVEIAGDTLSIRLINCPFRSVALENKAVCSFDENLISTMLGVDLTQEGCIREGATCCTYVTHVGPEDAELLSASIGIS
jgi:predicted ArsR family transcriptional regulator